MFSTVAKKLRAFRYRRNRADVFTKIYKDGLWGEPESVSGTGSSEAATEGIRRQLPKLFSTIEVRSLIDIPCGDFHWMQALVRESDVRVYAIGLFERPRFLEKLADETGGGVIWVRKLSELPAAMERLSAEIRNEYSIGYYSDHAQSDGKYHKVRIEVTPPDSRPLLVSWRRGYRAP